MARVQVCVFSFNRGPFLKNCIESVRAHTSWPLSVWDDDSRDPATLDVLSGLEADGVPVYRAGSDMVREDRTGGLYGNMYAALQDGRDEGVEYLLFIQDDQQVVRPVDDEVITHADQFFTANEHSFLLHTFFLKQVSFRHDRSRMVLDSSGLAYFRQETGPGRYFFSAVGFFSVARFWELCGQRLVGEGAYENWCREHGVKMGFYVYPFAMWNPYPTAWRKQRRPLLERWIDAIGGAGLHRISPMTKEAQRQLLTRDPSILPVAERHMVAPTSPSHTCFSTEGGVSNLMCRGGWRKGLGMTLLQFKRLQSRLKQAGRA